MDRLIRILVVDDHTIFRSGIRQLVDSREDMEVVGEARDGAEALTLVESLQPDVILMDIAMAGMDGIEATRRLKARWADIAILVLTMHEHEEYFFEILKAGASGYVLKGDGISDLVDAIHVVNKGKVFLTPDMTGRLVKDYLTRMAGTKESNQFLSPREKEILRLMAEGYSSKAIAEKLVISPSTVHSHRSNIMNKLNLSTRHELIQYAQDRGYTRDF